MCIGVRRLTFSFKYSGGERKLVVKGVWAPCLHVRGGKHSMTSVFLKTHSPTFMYEKMKVHMLECWQQCDLMVFLACGLDSECAFEMNYWIESLSGRWW